MYITTYIHMCSYVCMDLIFPGRVTVSLIPMSDGKSHLTVTAGQVCLFNSVKELLKLLFLGSIDCLSEGSIPAAALVSRLFQQYNSTLLFQYKITTETQSTYLKGVTLFPNQSLAISHFQENILLRAVLSMDIPIYLCRTTSLA